MKNNNRQNLWILLCVFILNLSYSQKINYYIQSIRYDNHITNQHNFKNYDFIGHAYIDKNNSGIIDYNLLKNRLLKMYPNKSDSSLVIINLENRIYNNLKSQEKKERTKAVNEFVNLIRYIKKLRPNLQVAVYGIPFRFNYDFQKKMNYKNDLLPLMKEVDFLAPDLYFSYAKSEQTTKSYKKILNGNLDLFIDFANEVNKPLKIFVWYKIHPYNKNYGNTKVEIERMKELITTIEDKQRTNTIIDGVLWWDSWETINENSKKKLTNNLLYYIK